MAEHCLFCGNFVQSVDDRCERCGVERRTLDEKRVHAPCPRCHLARLAPYALGTVALHACPRCKGAFLPATEWDALLDVYAAEELPEIVIADVDLPDADVETPYRSSMPPREDPRPNLDDPVRCPTCDEEMSRLEFAMLSKVIIDVCPAHGVWLDAGEIESVVRSRQPQMPKPRVPKPEPVGYVRPKAAAPLIDALHESPREHENPGASEVFTLRPELAVPEEAHEAKTILSFFARLVRWIRTRVEAR